MEGRPVGTAALSDGLSPIGRLVASLVLGATLVVAPTASGWAPPAAADPDSGPGWGGSEGDGGVDVEGRDRDEQTGPGSPGGTKIYVPGPWTQRVYTPHCPPNMVYATGDGVRDYQFDPDVMCDGAFANCPDGEMRMWVFERPMNANNRATDSFSRAGSTCRGADDPSDSEPPSVTVDEIIDRARALAPTPTFVIEPAARSYVNVPTNFAAEVEPVTVEVEVLGFTIPVDFTPGEVRWSFGDGADGSGVGIRHAAVGQEGAVEHAYGRSGRYEVTLAVDYDAQIHVPNGDPIVLPTPITRQSEAQSLLVDEIQSVVTEVG